MANSKLASAETQAKRGAAFSKTALIVAFVMLMSIPVLNFVFGMGVVIFFGVGIFARSGQRGVDFLWLLAGAAVCFAGMLLPAFSDHNHTSYATDWFEGVILNVLVGVFILGNRLWHLFQTDSAPSQETS